VSKHSRRDRDYEYMGFVKCQPCLLGHLRDCEGPVEADHAGERVGYRAPDSSCISLCSKHHRDRHASAGFFSTMTRAQRRVWLDDKIAETRGRYCRRFSAVQF